MRRLLPRRDFAFLGKLTRRRATVKFVYRRLRQILATGDVDGLKPAPFPPAPAGARRHADLLQPFGQADDRARAV